MKVLILGAGGIVGQHLRVTQPDGVDAVYFRKAQDDFHAGFDFDRDIERFGDVLAYHQPDAIINLAGESRVDVVERDPQAYYNINVLLPLLLADWCNRRACLLIQISSQAVFGGDNRAPYPVYSERWAVNAYGKQKIAAEDGVRAHSNWTIARLTFVLGLRPFDYGRRNPLEDMLEQPEQRQVIDKWFSPCLASDAAEQLWWLLTDFDSQHIRRQVYHIGLPLRVSRYDLALMVNELNDLRNHVSPVAFASFTGLAPRPNDTTWDLRVIWPHIDPQARLKAYLQACIKEWRTLHEQSVAE